MNGVLLPCQIEGVSTRRDKTLKIVLGTQELSPHDASQVLALVHKMAITYISPKELIEQKEIDQVDRLDPEFGGKTQSQRIRATLFVAFDQNKENFKDFDSYYKFKTERFIDEIKSKLNP